MTPLHLRKKIKAEPQKPKHFEIMPPSGILSPGQRINVQVKFMPTEEVSLNSKDWRLFIVYKCYKVWKLRKPRFYEEKYLSGAHFDF